MGWELWRSLLVWSAANPLTGREYRLLNYMVHVARDDDDPPVYFAGRLESLFALGQVVPDEPAAGSPQAAEIRRQRRAAFNELRVVIKGLVDKGAIRRRNHAHAGERAVYEIAIPPRALQLLHGTEGSPRRWRAAESEPDSEAERRSAPY
jgi:hypothetical protein